ncbi:hypothetical protein VPH35_117806 [Triticum aestivum]
MLAENLCISLQIILREKFRTGGPAENCARPTRSSRISSGPTHRPPPSAYLIASDDQRPDPLIHRSRIAAIASAPHLASTSSRASPPRPSATGDAVPAGHGHPLPRLYLLGCPATIFPLLMKRNATLFFPVLEPAGELLQPTGGFASTGKDGGGRRRRWQREKIVLGGDGDERRWLKQHEGESGVATTTATTDERPGWRE